jgi:hypothetical protein
MNLYYSEEIILSYYRLEAERLFPIVFQEEQYQCVG